jgi:hypothetical protein
MSEKGPVDTKAAVFVVVAVVFLGSVGFVLSDRMRHHEDLPTVSGPSAPGTSPASTPQPK